MSPLYRINYGFEANTDVEELKYGQSIVKVRTDRAVDSPEQLKEICRTIGMNNGYLSVAIQQIIEVDEDDIEIRGDNSERFKAN